MCDVFVGSCTTSFVACEVAYAGVVEVLRALCVVHHLPYLVVEAVELLGRAEQLSYAVVSDAFVQDGAVDVGCVGGVRQVDVYGVIGEPSGVALCCECGGCYGCTSLWVVDLMDVA